MRFCALFCAAFLGLLAVGCGADADSSEDTGPASAPSASLHPSKHGGTIEPLRVSAAGTESLRVAGGDNSIQEFGSEGEDGELQQAASAVHEFFVAKVEERWQRACLQLAATTVESLEQLATQSGRQGGGGGCPDNLAELTGEVTPSLARALTAINAAALRLEGDRAFLLYTGPPGSTAYAMPMAGGSGNWKPAAISGAALPGA